MGAQHSGLAYIVGQTRMLLGKVWKPSDHIQEVCWREDVALFERRRRLAKAEIASKASAICV